MLNAPPWIQTITGNGPEPCRRVDVEIEAVLAVAVDAERAVAGLQAGARRTSCWRAARSRLRRLRRAPAKIAERRARRREWRSRISSPARCTAFTGPLAVMAVSGAEATPPMLAQAARPKRGAGEQCETERETGASCVGSWNFLRAARDLPLADRLTGLVGGGRQSKARGARSLFSASFRWDKACSHEQKPARCTVRDGRIVSHLLVCVRGFTLLACCRFLPDLLYAHADDPRVVAWNWSFFPLDLAFSLTGLAAVRLSRRGSPLWKPIALISLILTMVAGGMAVGYWALLGEFDPAWFLPNLALLLWPMIFLPRLVRSMGQLPPQQ